MADITRHPRVRFKSGWRNRVAEAIYETVNELLNEGVNQFTVRQLFYQLVSKGVFESTRQNYKNFDATLVKLREEDPWLDSKFIDSSKPRFEYYMRTYWEGQQYFVEIWCVPPDTLVYTLDGVKPIDSVRVGDYVLTHRGRFRKVTKVFRRWYKGKIISVKVLGYYKPIRLTPEHKVLAIKSKRCPFKSEVICKPICYQADVCKYRLFRHYKLEWIPASMLEKGDIVVFPALTEINSIRKISIGKVEIPLKTRVMKVFGYWISEGSVGSRSARWTFNVRELKYIGDVVDTLLMLGFNTKVGRYSSKNTKVVITYSKDLLEWLVKNFGERSHTKRIPSWALMLPRNLQIELLKGILYGDHSYDKNRIRFATSSPVLAHQIAMLLVRLGYAPTIAMVSKERHPLAKHDMYTVSISGKQLEDFLFKFKLNLPYNAKHKFQRVWNDGNYAYYIVREVNVEDYEGYVYNLAVEEDESYVAGCMAVHNCEKDALRRFFEPYARRYNVNLVVCRGYPSVTRLREAKEQSHVPPDVRYIVLYFGDFDPSGEDIFRWINEELRPYNIEVIKVALTREQVEQYNLPPMIPKSTDPRYRRHVERYGEVAVELDALHPATLREIIRNAILQYMNVDQRLNVEVEEEIYGEVFIVVDDVLSEIRARLTEIARERIRNQVMQNLPQVREELKRRIEAGEEIDVRELYDREEVIEEIRRELRRVICEEES